MESPDSPVFQLVGVHLSPAGGHEIGVVIRATFAFGKESLGTTVTIPVPDADLPTLLAALDEVRTVLLRRYSVTIL